MATQTLDKILIIQTAFIGDVVLATVVIEKIKAYYPQATIDFLVRKGNESVLKNHPHLHELLVWDKQHDKQKNYWALVRQIRRRQYDVVINLQRFLSSGMLTVLSGAKMKIGFDKNPMSYLFTHKVRHRFASSVHEVDRNISLIAHLTDNKRLRPRLYPTEADALSVARYQHSPYLCIAPTSVWFTKQWAMSKWKELLNHIPAHYQIYLLGASADAEACNSLRYAAQHPKVLNLAGKLSLLESACLMKGAVMNYVNDSAPMHLASAVNAPTCAIYCSTLPGFGFGPLAERSFVIEVQERLSCRPCGLHGHAVCPQGHFKCAMDIDVQQLLAILTPPSTQA